MSFKLVPTTIDRRVADFVQARTSPIVEDLFNTLTLAGDERAIFGSLALVSVFLLRAGRRKQTALGHLWLSALSAAAVVHLAKRYVDQRRPDRTEAPLKLKGVRHAGKAYDAFPSGHALYMGALASALSKEAPLHRSLIWLCASAVASTRVVVLAHWLSDVLIGLAIGALTDRIVRWIKPN